MKEYLFSVHISGVGNNVDEAWKNAVKNNKLEEYTTPDERDWDLIDEEVNEY